MAKAKQEKETMAIMPLTDMGKVFVRSGFFSDTKDEAQAIVKIMAGQEVGLRPIEAMTGIHIIKGKITLGSNVMASAVKRHPEYDYRVKKLTDQEAEIEFFHLGKSIGVSSFSMDDAQRAGLVVSGGSWKKYPKAMLFARAMSQGVRFYCPDVFGHAPVYVPEEMGAEVDEDGEPINITPPPITVPPVTDYTDPVIDTVIEPAAPVLEPVFGGVEITAEDDPHEVLRALIDRAMREERMGVIRDAILRAEPGYFESDQPSVDDLAAGEAKAIIRELTGIDWPERKRKGGKKGA